MLVSCSFVWYIQGFINIYVYISSWIFQTTQTALSTSWAWTMKQVLKWSSEFRRWPDLTRRHNLCGKGWKVLHELWYWTLCKYAQNTNEQMELTSEGGTHFVLYHPMCVLKFGRPLSFFRSVFTNYSRCLQKSEGISSFVITWIRACWNEPCMWYRGPFVVT